MGEPLPHRPVLLILAAFSQFDDALAWAARQAEDRFGPIAMTSPMFQFTETDYYDPTMGSPLGKRFFAFERLIDPAALPEIKLATGEMEQAYAAEQADRKGVDALARPLNLDPGYISLGKLVLASTKDHAHRLYLGQGIYAEITLRYRRRIGWQPSEWTFADYRRDDYHAFFDRCRDYLQARRR